MAWKSSHMFLLYIANRHESSSKWKKKNCIQNAKGNIPKLFQIVSCTMAHLSWKYHENPFMCFSVMWLTDRQIEQPTHNDENTTFTGLSSFYSLILDSSVALSAGIQSALGSILYSAEEDILSPFDSKIACLCQSIGINNNKHVYRQRQVRIPNGSGVEWAECSLILEMGCQVQVFQLDPR